MRSLPCPRMVRSITSGQGRFPLTRVCRTRGGQKQGKDGAEHADRYRECNLPVTTATLVFAGRVPASLTGISWLPRRKVPGGRSVVRSLSSVRVRGWRGVITAVRVVIAATRRSITFHRWASRGRPVRTAAHTVIVVLAARAAVTVTVATTLAARAIAAGRTTAIVVIARRTVSPAMRAWRTRPTSRRRPIRLGLEMIKVRYEPD